MPCSNSHYPSYSLNWAGWRWAWWILWWSGRLPHSAQAIGAVGIGSVVFYTVGVFGMGLLLGLDTLVSQAFGAGDIKDCQHSLLHGIYLSLAAAPILMGIVWLWMSLLGSMGIEPDVRREAGRYLNAIIWSTLPLLLHYAFRRYLQGMNIVRPVMFALFTANLVNLAANWVLVFGNLGAPAMGVAGSGWATCFSRGYMAVFLGLYIVYHDRRHRTGLFHISPRLDISRIRELLRLGLPAAGQTSIEVGVFAAATALIGRLDDVSLAAHQIAIMAISVSYMIPLGLASAAAVRVGQAIGRGDPKGAALSGWTALLLGSLFEAVVVVLFVFAGASIGREHYARPDDYPDGGDAAAARRIVRTVRRFPDRLDGRAARSGRYAHADDLPLRRLLDPRPARGLVSLFSPRLGRRRILGRIRRGPDPVGSGAARGMAAEEQAAGRRRGCACRVGGRTVPGERVHHT